MKQLSEEQRQLAGCGFLPPPEEKLRPYVQPWQGLGYSGKSPTVCPGYSVGLPETIEVARARLHWSKGSLESFCDGRPSDALLGAIEILESTDNERSAWSLDNPEKRGS